MKKYLINPKIKNFIRVLAICCAVYIFIAFKDGNNILKLLKQDSILKYVNISNGLKSIAANMILGMKILSLSSIVIYIINGIRTVNNGKISEIIDIILDLLILISLGMYSLIYCGFIKVSIENDIRFLNYLICILIMVVVLFVHILVAFNSQKDLMDNKLVTITECVAASCLAVFTLIMLGKSTVTAANIYSGIGTVLERGLAVNSEIEEAFGNYRYDGVLVQNDLYYIDQNRTDNNYEINMIDEDGNITKIFSSVSPIEDIFYHDGKLYVMSYSDGGNVNSIDVATGEEALVLNKKGLFNYGIADDNLYYLIEECEEDGSDNLKIFQASIDDINNAELFLNRFQPMSGLMMLFNTNAFYGTFIYGDEKYLDNECIASVQATDQEYKGFNYGIKSQHTKPLSSIPGLLVICHDDVELKQINSVTAYNVANETLFYATANDASYKLYKADLSGNNPECICEGTDDRIERIFTTPDFVIIMYVSGEVERVFVGT